jgi:hypothetical protein
MHYMDAMGTVCLLVISRVRRVVFGATLPRTLDLGRCLVVDIYATFHMTCPNSSTRQHEHHARLRIQTPSKLCGRYQQYAF